VGDPQDNAAASDSTGATATGDAGLLDNVAALSRDIGLLAREQLELLSLEAQVATRSVIVMLASAVAVGVLLVTVWLALVAALVWLLRDGGGVSPLQGLLMVAALNLVAGGVLVVLIRRHWRNLGFPLTRRSLATLVEARDGVAR
jgi:Putative Actinobacterial Holin-X, holin superfamily III